MIRCSSSPAIISALQTHDTSKTPRHEINTTPMFYRSSSMSEIKRNSGLGWKSATGSWLFFVFFEKEPLRVAATVFGEVAHMEDFIAHRLKVGKASIPRRRFPNWQKKDFWRKDSFLLQVTTPNLRDLHIETPVVSRASWVTKAFTLTTQQKG